MLVQLGKKKCSFLADITLHFKDSMMSIFLKYLNLNGLNLQIRNQDQNQKMLNQKLEPQIQELICHVHIIKEKFIYLEDMVEVDIEGLHLMICIHMTWKLLIDN